MKSRTRKNLTALLAALSAAALLCACGKTVDAPAPAPEVSASASVSGEASLPEELPAPRDPAPAAELPAEETPAPAPERSDPAPEQSAPVPEKPAPAPEKPDPAPEKPTPAPEKPAPAPEKPTPAPEKSDPAPEKPTPAPEKSDPAPEPSEPTPESPAPAPAWEPDISFTTVDMNGKTWTDKCFADSKLTVLNYWAYWCGPCVGELPALQKLSEEYALRGVQVLGLYQTDEEAENAVVASKLGLTYPCLRYPSAFDAYIDPSILPTTVFVDSNGKVVGKVYIGARNYERWVSAVESALGE